MTRKVVILQSNYIPWKGYFDLINDADIFVFYDEVQFTKNDWRNRNRFKTASGSKWLSVPVGKEINRTISEVTLDVADWQEKHYRSLVQEYSKCPHYSSYSYLLESIYKRKTWRLLSELNQFAIKEIASCLGIDVTFISSDKLGNSGKKSERLVSIVKAVGGDRYISGPAAKSYLDEETFRRSGISVIWKDYENYPVYSQRHPPFDHNVTILDLIFNEGPRSADYIWNWRKCQD